MGSMSTSKILDVRAVCSFQSRSLDGLRVDVVTAHRARTLVRGEFEEASFEGVVRDQGQADDVVNTFWAAVFLVSDRFVRLVEESRVTGCRFTPVLILTEPWRLWLLSVTGRCGRLYGADGDRVPGLDAIGSYLDPREWDGSDVFLTENHNAIFVAPSCLERFRAAGLSNLELRLEGLSPLPRPH